MRNLQRSELVIARILNQLIDYGLQDAELKFSDLGLKDEYAPFFTVCVEWLLDEGIIRCGNFSKFKAPEGVSGIMLNPVLTAYGLQILNQKLDINDSAVKLSEAVKTVSENEKPYAQLGSFVGGVLGGFTKSIGS